MPPGSRDVEADVRHPQTPRWDITSPRSIHRLGVMRAGQGMIVDATERLRHPHVRVHGQRRLSSQRPARAAPRRLPASRPGPARHGVLPPRDGAAIGDHAGHGRERRSHQPQSAGARNCSICATGWASWCGTRRSTNGTARPTASKASHRWSNTARSNPQFRAARPQPSLRRRLVDRQRDLAAAGRDGVTPERVKFMSDFVRKYDSTRPGGHGLLHSRPG